MAALCEVISTRRHDIGFSSIRKHQARGEGRQNFWYHAIVIIVSDEMCNEY